MALEHRRADVIEAELLEWSDQLAAREQTLAEQEAALADAVAAFEQEVRDFAGRFTERRSPGLWDALRMVRAAFPMGLVIEAWAPRPDATVH